MSAGDASPVERISGLPVRAMAAISGVSTISNEATLNAGAPSPSRNATAVGSNGEEKQAIPAAAAWANSRGCQSQGVCASWYSSYSLRPSHSPPSITNPGPSWSMVRVSAV